MIADVNPHDAPESGYRVACQEWSPHRNSDRGRTESSPASETTISADLCEVVNLTPRTMLEPHDYHLDSEIRSVPTLPSPVPFATPDSGFPDAFSVPPER